MSVSSLRTLEQLYTRDDQRLEPDEALRLVDASRDGGAVTPDERAHLASTAAAPRTTEAARHVIEGFLARPAPSELPLRAVRGADASTFTDDRLVLGADGRHLGHSSVTPFSRGYVATRAGTLLEVHGSPAPRSSLSSRDEHARVFAQPPADALDRMAKERGVKLGAGFRALAEAAFEPEAPHWWGKCHAWAWAALSSELSARVDVGGREGQRGLWLSGEWLSRADLGNFLMGVADRISLRDREVQFQGPVTPMDLLHATAQYLVEGGGGFVADLHNDAAHDGEREVWNQPFVAADVDTKTLAGEGAQAVLALAKSEGVAGLSVKHVHVVGRYGNERGDGYEGPAHLQSRSWNLYAVTDATGAVVAAYQADDERLEGARGLPTRSSSELPEYVWKPSLRALEAGLSNEQDPAIDGDPLAREYRFFVGTVLKKGVPGGLREAFEDEVRWLPPGPLAKETRQGLLARYAGVAEAYTRAQWEQHFGARGLTRKDFSTP